MKAAINLNMPEDERIAVIGNTVMQSRQSVWCMTDDLTDEQGDKPERYKKKLAELFPLLRLGSIRRGFPGKGCAGFTVEPPKFS